MIGMTDVSDWSAGFAVGVMTTVWSALLGLAMTDILAAVSGFFRWLWKRLLVLWRWIASHMTRRREDGR